MKKVFWQYNGYTVKNSVSFVETVKELQISPWDHLVSFDVMNLFTQVPITEALEVIEEKLASNLEEQNQHPSPPPGGTREALPSIILRPISNSFYEQTDGAAMGSPSRPSLQTCT